MTINYSDCKNATDRAIAFAVNMGIELNSMIESGFASPEMIASMRELTRRADHVALVAVTNRAIENFAPSANRYADTIRWNNEYQVITIGQFDGADHIVYAAQDKNEARMFAECYEQGAVWA
jgi:hypothetical protein